MREMLIETELTPNPSTIKFLPGRVVMDTGTRDFASPEEAEASPLAEALFALGDVTGTPQLTPVATAEAMYLARKSLHF